MVGRSLYRHPPQAYNLGRFIGQKATTEKTTTIVATHSSQILRGIIQTTRNVEIVRMTRSKGQFHAHRLLAEQLTEAIKKPALRAEAVLDGIFSETVLIVESDNDRLVYSTAWERLGGGGRLDVHFAEVGGTGGIAETCRFYRSLNIPVAVITDRDIVADTETLLSIVSAMSNNADQDTLRSTAKQLSTAITEIPPAIGPEEFQRLLADIDALPKNWENQDDIKIAKSLRRLSNDVYRMRRVKHGAISDLPESVAKPLVDLIQQLKRRGIFIVPVGELEDWFRTDRIKASKQTKGAWANEAAHFVQSEEPTAEGIWAFLREIEGYLALP